MGNDEDKKNQVDFRGQDLSGTQWTDKLFQQAYLQQSMLIGLSGIPYRLRSQKLILRILMNFVKNYFRELLKIQLENFVDREKF